MGAIRKTLSIATLGIVNFRSKSERLARAENERDLALAAGSEASARAEKLSARARRAEKRAKKAEWRALGEAKKSRRERRRADRSADSTVVGASDRAVVLGRRARRKAKKEAKQLARSGRAEFENVSHTIADKTHDAVDMVGDAAEKVGVGGSN
ncbi:MAG: hypothetical protein R2710_03110 [Acidimicrobiales bacterium]